MFLTFCQLHQTVFHRRSSTGSLQLQNVPSVVETANPEKLTFASKVKNFEREIEVQKLATKQASASSLPSPGKRFIATRRSVIQCFSARLSLLFQQ